MNDMDDLNLPMILNEKGDSFWVLYNTLRTRIDVIPCTES